MTYPADLQELLTRIVDARNWAAEEAARYQALAEEAVKKRKKDTVDAATVLHVAYDAVVEVLDEILIPGRHSGRITAPR